MAVKARGILPQRQKGFATLRFVVGGQLTVEQMRKLADLARREGKEMVLTTMRKTVELPWIRLEKVPQVLEECAGVGLKPGSTGMRTVKAVLPCAATYRCAFEATDVMGLYDKVATRYFGRDAPAKFKISISGCPNYCMHPYLNDIGIVGRVHPRINLDKCIACGQCARLCRGEAITQKTEEYPASPLPTKAWEEAVEMNRAPVFDATTPLDAIILDEKGLPHIDYDKCIDCGLCVRNCPTDAIEVERSGFTVMVGGRGGRRARFGNEIVRIASEEELFTILDRTLEYHEKFAQGRERLPDAIERLGLEHYKEHALEGLELDGKQCSTMKARSG